jgi:S-adenosylmethionine hydrolase
LSGLAATPGPRSQPIPERPIPDTVFFVSDYGRTDEFVGVVHAVLRRLAPHARVIDLTHDVPAFDVRAGSATLARALPHLGPGVVLAVVDPGVGGPRRGVVVELAPQSREAEGPRWFVGPDNGLLTPALDPGDRIAAASVLASPAGSATFDGRDVFAPAAAALCAGAAPDSLGSPVDPSGLCRLPGRVVELGTDEIGRHHLTTEVTWVDHFGNVQLAGVADLVPLSVTSVKVGVPTPARSVARVRTFGDLRSGEAGLLTDANSCLALVVNRGSAAEHFGLVAGSTVELVW